MSQIYGNNSLDDTTINVPLDIEEIGSNFTVIQAVEETANSNLIDLTRIFYSYGSIPNRFLISYQEEIKRETFNHNSEDVLARKSLDSVTPDPHETKRVSKDIEQVIEDLRNLLVLDLAPIQLGINQAWYEAESVLRTITDNNDLTIEKNGIEKMLEKAFQIKLINCITKRLQLTDDDRKILLDYFLTTKTQTTPTGYQHG